jgi:hypothetical protein
MSGNQEVTHWIFGLADRMIGRKSSPRLCRTARWLAVLFRGSPG